MKKACRKTTQLFSEVGSQAAQSSLADAKVPLFSMKSIDDLLGEKGQQVGVEPLTMCEEQAMWRTGIDDILRMG